MLTFCPNCSNMLQISPGPTGTLRFECKTCPYQFPIVGEMEVFERKQLYNKQVDDVLGGKDAWVNVDQTAVRCPRSDCEGVKAYFYQLQIRSADEPMTTFYKCTLCGNQWSEN